MKIEKRTYFASISVMKEPGYEFDIVTRSFESVENADAALTAVLTQLVGVIDYVERDSRDYAVGTTNIPTSVN